MPQSAIFCAFSENLFVAEKSKTFLAENADLQFLADLGQKHAPGMSTQKAQRKPVRILHLIDRFYIFKMLIIKII